MSNKTQLQTNNTALNGYIARINAAKDVAASLPEAGGSSGSIETCTVTLHDDPYLAIKTAWYYTDVNMTLQQYTGSGEITVPKNTLMAFIYYPDMSYRFYGNNITSILSASIDAENACEVVQIYGDCEIEITYDDDVGTSGPPSDPLDWQ